MCHKEIEAFLQTKESTRHLLSLTTTNYSYDVNARAYTSSQIITVVATVYHGEDATFSCCLCHTISEYFLLHTFFAVEACCWKQQQLTTSLFTFLA